MFIGVGEPFRRSGINSLKSRQCQGFSKRYEFCFTNTEKCLDGVSDKCVARNQRKVHIPSSRCETS